MKLVYGLAAGVGLLALAALPHAGHAAPAAACHAPQGGDQAYYPVVMTRAADQVDEDPAKVWTKYELWNVNAPAHTTIWQGVMPVCGGELIVSQIMNRQCSSAAACPTRIVYRDTQQERVLLDYKQVCTIHQGFELRGDAGALRACDQAVMLKAVRRD